MRTTVEYNSKLALGDKVTFCLDSEKLVGRVSNDDEGYWLNFHNFDKEQDHDESVDKVFSHFGIEDKSDFRDQVIGREWEGDSGVWPYTSSLEELKKMLDSL